MAKAPKKADTPKAKLLANRPEPNEKEAARMAAASDRVAAKRRDHDRPRVPESAVRYDGPNRVLVASPHTDDTGWAAQLCDALGTADGRVSSMLQSTACLAGPTNKVESQEQADRLQGEINEALAFAAENRPANPIEAALLLQMVAVHRVSMAMAQASLTADRRDVQSDSVKQMNQTMRTYAAQAEALNKLRTGGKQVHEVRYVYVDARTQTVINGAGGSGVGAGVSIPDQQSLAPFPGLAAPAGLPMWSPDASGDALPIASGEGQGPLPDARRDEPRRSQGRGERQLHLRALDAGGQGAAGKRAGARKAVS